MQEIQEIWIQSLGQEDALEKEMTTHSGILAMDIGARLQSMGLQKSQTRLNDWAHVILIYISLILKKEEHIPPVYWPNAIYLLWNFLPIFLVSCKFFPLIFLFINSWHEVLSMI